LTANLLKKKEPLNTGELRYDVGVNLGDAGMQLKDKIAADPAVFLFSDSGRSGKTNQL